MSDETQIAKLIQTKLALVAKYQRLAKAAKSKPRQKVLNHHAERYRRQVEDLSHQR